MNTVNCTVITELHNIDRESEHARDEDEMWNRYLSYECKRMCIYGSVYINGSFLYLPHLPLHFLMLPACDVHQRHVGHFPHNGTSTTHGSNNNPDKASNREALC